MRRRDVLRLLTLASAATLGAACQLSLPPLPPGLDATPTPPTPAPLPPPTLAPTEVAAMPGIRLAIDLDPDTLDPAGQTNPTVSSIVDHLAETLVRLQPDGSIGPGLARTFSQSADGRTFMFELRPYVEFHDGSLLNAEAATLSLQRFLNGQLRVPLRAPFDTSLVDSITPIDPLTLRITLKDTSRLFLQKLAATELAIVSPIVPEVATRESLLLANQVELILQPPLSDLPALQKNPNLKVVLTPTARSTFVAMDLTLPGGTPLAIKKVRQALNYAIDRDGIIRNVMFGAATPLDAPMASTLVGYARVGGYSYDPNRARQMLVEGGTPHLQLRFMHLTGRSMQEALAAQLAQAVAGNLRDVGVDTELIGSDWPTFLAAIAVAEDKGTAHMHLFNWAPTFLDASQQMTQFVRSSWPPQGLATSHYWNPKVELLVSQAARERDDQKRQDQYAGAQRAVWDDAPWIFLWSPSSVMVHSARLKGISMSASEKFSAAYAEPV